MSEPIVARLRSPVVLGGLLLLALVFGSLVLHVGSAGIGALKATAIVVGAAAVASGLFGRRVLDVYRDAAVTVCSVVVLLAVLEMAARLYMNRVANAGQVETTVTSSTYYRNKPWGERFQSEVAASRRRAIYEPYILWSRSPFRGETVNVGERGERLTPGAACHQNSFTVLTFGGSTMWGVGSPDWTTIPAFLQKGIQALRRDSVCVRNLGEVGFVSTQEILKLTRELREGRVPQAVVFYDGVNDVLTAYDFRRVGVHYEFDDIRRKLEGPAAQQLLAQSALVQLAGRRKVANRPLTTSELDSLAQGVVNNYYANVRLVAALSREYGFAYDFFWQPVLFVGRSRPADEAVARRTVPDPFIRFYRDVYRRMADAPAQPHVHNISAVLDSVATDVYLDFGHLLPEGNAIVAQRMLTDLAPSFRQAGR